MKNICLHIIPALIVIALFGGCTTAPSETKSVEKAAEPVATITPPQKTTEIKTKEPVKRPPNPQLNEEEVRCLRELHETQEREIIKEEAKRVMDWQKCAIVEYNHYMKELRAKLRGKPKFDLMKLTGHALGESSECQSPHEYFCSHPFGQSCEIGDRFPPFGRMHRLFGAAPGNPMEWCHMGSLESVSPDALTVRGDYANEARLIKKRIEDACGLAMSEDPGKGYRYEDEYVLVTVSTNLPSHKPLVVDVRDKVLADGDKYIRSRLEYWKFHAWKNWDLKKIQEFVNEFDKEYK